MDNTITTTQQTLPELVSKLIQESPDIRKQKEILSELQEQTNKQEILRKAGLYAKCRSLWYDSNFSLRRKQLLQELWTLKITKGKVFKELNFSEVNRAVQEYGKKIGKSTLTLLSCAVDQYSGGVPPTHVLQTLAKHRELGIFDDFKIWYASEIKDPILVGVTYDFMNSRERTFYLDHWGDDIPFDQIGIE